ncbi:hypothetical protein PARPLA_02317 [Rhodobacteraceae bacterium THAF1]|uniref:hypothetical protein n=1 Tax=Palleronia sp. THAF1 TaxID=2587842 RepID=UPI000F418FB6|nr:hypothetical protein [Palleronia sp. THAF1]QFU09351.1 hypothetical protein FIU81_11765 [Palleronia sp. THAF1]VDC26817.1 hypothetical protein PARPLA_02317 [Rhodobacteraceae bacterium THAF1]
MTKTAIILGLAAFTGLAACGNTDLERAGTGAVGGGLAGEVLLDEPVAGAAAGAAVGALSDDV